MAVSGDNEEGREKHWVLHSCICVLPKVFSSTPRPELGNTSGKHLICGQSCVVLLCKAVFCPLVLLTVQEGFADGHSHANVPNRNCYGKDIE